MEDYCEKHLAELQQKLINKKVASNFNNIQNEVEKDTNERRGELSRVKNYNVLETEMDEEKVQNVNIDVSANMEDSDDDIDIGMKPKSNLMQLGFSGRDVQSQIADEMPSSPKIGMKRKLNNDEIGSDLELDLSDINIQVNTNEKLRTRTSKRRKIAEKPKPKKKVKKAKKPKKVKGNLLDNVIRRRSKRNRK